MNLIGINETIDIAITKWPTDDQLRATIQRTHELGGLAIINHIPWSNTTGNVRSMFESRENNNDKFLTNPVRPSH